VPNAVHEIAHMIASHLHLRISYYTQLDRPIFVLDRQKGQSHGNTWTKHTPP